MTNRRVWIGICCLLTALLGSAPAWSQGPSFNGLYTLVDNQTGVESLVRLEYVPVPPSPRYGSFIATIFEGNGRFRVFAGPIIPSGGPWRIPSLLLYEAKRPYRFLKNPRLLDEELERHLRLEVQCQIQLLVSDTLNYSCFDLANGSSSSGRLVRIR